MSSAPTMAPSLPVGLSMVSGLFGFCPMCAMVGRRLDKAAKQAKI